MELQTGAVKVRKDRMSNLYRVNLGLWYRFFPNRMISYITPSLIISYTPISVLLY